ncbi:MAG TPA: tRNA lysidine(34) synthetase TilS, partial [Deltaproteobacteria bacterium]|nr:tRNA lysidine(34) synthetase TilS [Deltaproteobacteria bacterium]
MTMSAHEVSSQLMDQMMDEGLLPDPDGVAVIAVSGGLDSTALARLLGPPLARAGVEVHLAHVAHGLRGAESEEDWSFVDALARDLGLPVHRLEGSVAPERTRAIGVEGAAREVRYNALADLANRLGASSIYLGHHRDDQLETLILRHHEGVPAARNAAMPARRGRICRPLLGMSRAHLHALGKTERWGWRNDSSNGDLRFARNRVRHELLPALRRESPDALETVLRLGQAALSGRAALEVQLPEARQRVARRDGPERWRLDRAEVASLEDDLAILLFQSLCGGPHRCDRPPSRQALLLLLAGVRAGGRARLFALGAGWFARVEGNIVLLSPQPIGYEESGAGSQDNQDLPQAVCTTSLSATEAQLVLDSADAPGRELAVFDWERVRHPLRTVETGSGRWMQPYGMAGRRKLRDLLAEAGVPRSERASWPAVVDARGEVLWLP